MDKMKMNNKFSNLGNVCSSITYIKSLSSSWEFSETYANTLNSLLNDSFKDIKIKNAKKDYDFFAKILVDGANKNKRGLKENLLIISGFIQDFEKTKNLSVLKKIFLSLFHLIILDMLLNKNFSSKFKTPNLEKILQENLTEDEELNFYKHIILTYLFGKVDNKFKITSDFGQDIEKSCLKLFYLYILISKEPFRQEEHLLEFYTTNSLIEKKILSMGFGNKDKLKLLKSAIILKVISGKGLYLPEIEREQYISSFAQKIVKDHYKSRLDDLDKIKKIPSWVFYPIILIIEALTLLFPKISELMPQSVPLVGDIFKYLGFLGYLPLWAILMINALLLGLGLYIQRKYINKHI